MEKIASSVPAAALSVGEAIQRRMARIRHLVDSADAQADYFVVRGPLECDALDKMLVFLELIQETSKGVDDLVGKLLEVDFEAMTAA